MWILPQELPCTCEAEFVCICCPRHGCLGFLWLENRGLEVCE